MSARFSELDSRRFGKSIYRALVEDTAAARDAIDSARREGADMLIARCPVSVLSVAQELERAGFLLMDTLVYYAGSTDRFTDPPLAPGLQIRRYQDGDRARLEAVASAAFTNYDGHYHADQRLSGKAATEGYVERLVLSTKNPSMIALVACLEDNPVGFLTLRWGDGVEPADIDLNAVDPAVQRRGVYSALFKAAGHAAREHGEKIVTISTNLSNLAPQKVWVRHGFELQRGYHTFHGWFDAGGK